MQCDNLYFFTTGTNSDTMRLTYPIKNRIIWVSVSGKNYLQHTCYFSLSKVGLVLLQVVHTFLFIPISKLHQSNELKGASHCSIKNICTLHLPKVIELHL